MAYQNRPNRPADDLAQTFRELAAAAKLATGSLTAMSGKPGGGLPTAAPWVDLTGAAPPPKTLTPDSDVKKAKLVEQQGPDWQKLAGQFRGVTSGLQSIASLGGQPASAVSAFGGQVGKLAEQFGGKYGQAIGQFIQTASQLPQLFRSAAESVNNYVQVFSPAVSARYQRAAADLMGAIGEGLVPVLEVATGITRFFADGMTGVVQVVKPFLSILMDQFRPVFDAAGEVFKELFGVVGQLVLAFVPLVKILADMGKGPIYLLTLSLKAAADGLEVVSKMLERIGLVAPTLDSTGKASRNATISTADDAWRQAVTAAAQQGRGAAENPVITKMDTVIGALKDLPKNIADAIKGVIGFPTGEKGKGVGDEPNAAPQSTADRDKMRDDAAIVGPAIFGPLYEIMRMQVRNQELRRGGQ